MTDLQALQDQLRTLSPHEQLRVARWLIDRAVDRLSNASSQPGPATNGLLALAGRFAGGPGDSAERAEAILETNVDAQTGLSST
jgi:hypothetical protein